MKKIILTVFLLSFLAAPVSAQNQEFLINWKSGVLAPAFYQGKILATNRAVIQASFEIVDGGRLIDLGSREVRWFVSGKLVSKGPGLQKTNFVSAPQENQNLAVRISIDNPGRNNLEEIFVIPLVRPEVVIEEPGVDKMVAAGVNVFRAWPFFFNAEEIKDIFFSWTANNQKTAGQAAAPNELELEIPDGGGGEIILTAVAQNKSNLLEIAKKTIKLLIK